jgi:hypothetical protein
MASTFDITVLVGFPEDKLLTMLSSSMDAIVSAGGNALVQSVSTGDLTTTFATNGDTHSPAQTVKACRYALQRMYYATDPTKYGTDLIRENKQYVY